MTNQQGRLSFEQSVKGQPRSYYSSGEHLRAKHRLIRTESGRRFEKWALNLISIKSTSTILDAGCGWGRFTWPLIQDYHVPPSNVVCTDLSLGMLQTASEEARQRGNAAHFVVGNIEALPFQDNRFDGGMANHVLYHLGDIRQGISELARVVKQTGWLLATGHSEQIQVPVVEMHYRALEHLGIAYTPEGPAVFSMENGAAFLTKGFHRVERYYFEDEERFADAEPFVQMYMTTGRYRSVLEREDVDTVNKQQLSEVFRALTQEVIQEQGVLRVPTLLGAFVCTEPTMG